jgi:EAL and modified HD-GYP domain-containing signal transduction protein
VAASSAPARPANAPQLYVARQPILDSREKVFGYELLFRDGLEDYFRNTDPDAASRSTLDTSILMGLDVLCDGRRAFINCTRETLLKDYVTLLPAGQVVVEIVESVPPDDLVKAACMRLKAAGYTIALDDFSVDDPRNGLVEFADLIKVDLKSSCAEEQTALVRSLGTSSCLMLAEKVETREEFTASQKTGFSYFQGYYFRRPELMHAREIPKNKANYLRLLQVISQDELDVREIEDVIKGEASLVYRLLRYLNSAAFSFSTQIHSIRHGLSILGEREVRRWVRLVATLGAAQNKPSDLVLSALVRARYCELIGDRILHGASDLFLMGLLSLMDAILEMPMGLVLEGIALDHEIRAVLLHQESRLTPFYQLMLSHELADWPRFSSLCEQLKFPEADANDYRWKAMRWARDVTAGQ